MSFILFHLPALLFIAPFPLKTSKALDHLFNSLPLDSATSSKSLPPVKIFWFRHWPRELIVFHSFLFLSFIWDACYFLVGTKCILNDLLDTIKTRINSWSKKIISIGGRCVLIRSILYEILTNLLAILRPPKGTINDLNNISVNCFWANWWESF